MKKESEILLVSADRDMSLSATRGTRGKVTSLSTFEELANALSLGGRKAVLVAIDARDKTNQAMDAIVSIRKKWNSHELPVLVIESRTTTDPRMMSMADDFILAPFTQAEWDARLDVLLSRYDNYPQNYHPANQLNLFQTVGSIATAFQNRTNEIQDQADLLASMLEMNNNDETRIYFSNVETASREAGKLARTLLDQLEEMRALTPVPMQVTPCLERLGREFSPDKLHIIVDGEIPAVMGHEKLFDALKELTLNAIDHSDLDVKITLTVARDKQHPWYVVLKVSDNGPGIMSENTDRMFTPFFTTKGAVKSGLGLWSVYLLVSSLRGEVRVESEFGKGAEFSIYLRCDN